MITINKKTDLADFTRAWNYDSELRYLQCFETQGYEPSMGHIEVAEEPEADITSELEPEYLNELYHHMLASLRSQ